MSNKEEKNLYIPNWGKYGIIITITWIGFVTSLYIFIAVLPNLSFLTLIIFLLAIFLTCYLPNKFLKKVSKTEFLDYYKNASTAYLERLLIKYGFNGKEMEKILKNRPIGNSVNSKYKEQSNNNPLYEVDSIEEFLNVCNSSEEEKEALSKYYNMFKKLSFSEKIKSCYGKGANTLASLKFDHYDYHAFFCLLCDSIDNSGNKDDLRKLIFEEIEREKKQNNYDLDYIEVDCLSSSNKTINNESYKMTIKDNYIYLLDWMYIIEDDLKEPFRNSKENYYSLYGADYYSFSKCTKYKIKKDDIIFYTTDGAIENYTVTSGGGTSGNVDEIKARIAQRSRGSNSSVLLSGDMAAMYSMLNDIKVDPITTEIVSNDKRVVIIKTKDIDLIFSREYHGDLYMWLIDKIPDKDLERMNILKEKDKDQNSNNSNLDEIKKLKELLDMGAITKEEFDKKKKELLK